MDWGRSEFARPASLALMGIAAVGWLVALFFWMQAVDLRAEGQEGLRRAEAARQALVSELQNLQRAIGSASELRQKLDDGRKALDDAVAQRSHAQNDLAELTHRVDETQLALASQTDQIESKAALLKDTLANLKIAESELSDLSAQRASVNAEMEKAQATLAAAQAAARAADASAVAAKSAEAEARAKADAAKAEFEAIQARSKAPAPK